MFMAGLLGGCGSGAVVPSDEQLRACATATACGVVPNFDQCIRYIGDIKGAVAKTGTGYFGPKDVTCMASAGHDCDAAARCANLGAAPASCSGTVASCDGDALHTCLGGVQRAFDCAALGLHCVVGASGAANCGAGACAAGNGGSCSLTGATLIQCVDGVQLPVDCTRDGAECRFVGGVIACVGDGRECQMTTTCDGDTIVSCRTGRQQRIDCAARGLHCVVNYHPNADFQCGNGTDCDPATVSASCDGAGKIHFCYLGSNLVADCKAAGFSGCSAGSCVR